MTLLPEEVGRAAGLPQDPEDAKGRRFVRLNDGIGGASLSFSEIADVIEADL